jgi:hypothetical protein
VCLYKFGVFATDQALVVLCPCHHGFPLISKSPQSPAGRGRCCCSQARARHVLGCNPLPSKFDTTTTHTFSRPTLDRIQQRWLPSNLGGQVPARKQGQRRSGHSVRRCSPNHDNLSLSFSLISLPPSSPLFSVYNKTLEYVKTFAKFNTTDSASAVRE